MPTRVAPLLLAAATVLALSGGSCSSDKSNGDDPALPTTRQPTTTTTAPPEDPFAIPEVIDAAYVDVVLAALNAVRGDAVRGVVSRGKIDFESIERLRAIYNDPEYEVVFQALRDQHARGLQAFKRPPGDRITKVIRVVRARPDCIFAVAKLDFSQVVVDAQTSPPGEVQAITLQPTQPDADPKRVNRTPWSISFEEVIQDDQVDGSRECV